MDFDIYHTVYSSPGELFIYFLNCVLLYLPSSSFRFYQIAIVNRFFRFFGILHVSRGPLENQLPLKGTLVKHFLIKMIMGIIIINPLQVLI